MRLATLALLPLFACSPASEGVVANGGEQPAESGEPSRSKSTEIPAGVQQLLPRGGIPAIFQPKFVPASSARIPDDAWVLGVVIDGEARAYSLNLLNRHEIVNDVLARQPIAAVW